VWIGCELIFLGFGSQQALRAFVLRIEQFLLEQGVCCVCRSNGRPQIDRVGALVRVDRM
jgi:hypothetical protein